MFHIHDENASIATVLSAKSTKRNVQFNDTHNQPSKLLKSSGSFTKSGRKALSSLSGSQVNTRLGTPATIKSNGKSVNVSKIAVVNNCDETQTVIPESSYSAASFSCPQ